MQDIITKNFKCTPELYKKSVVVIEEYLTNNKFIFRKINVKSIGIDFQIKVKNWFLHIYLEPNGLESDLNKTLKLTEVRVSSNFKSKEIIVKEVRDNEFLFPEDRLEIPNEISNFGNEIYKKCLVILKGIGLELEN